MISHLHLEYELYVVSFDSIDFIDVSMNSCAFSNMVILSGSMIYDFSFSSEYDKYVVNFD